MHLPLKWELPGGKIEENESAEECLKREIREELNIEIEVIESFESSIHQYGDEKKIELIPFLCCFIKGEIILKEHKKFCWKEVELLADMDWAAADIPIIQDFQNWYSQQNP